MEYSFVVKKAEKIDLDRILKEQKEAGNLVSVVTDGNTPKILLIHNKFLDKFNYQDNLTVISESLNPHWGKQSYDLQYVDQSFDINTGENELGNGRWEYLHGISLETVKQQIEKARNFKRKITVNVHTL